MKIKENYLLSEIEGEHIVITVGNVETSFNGYLKLNETSQFLWSCLEDQATLGDIIEQFKDKYSLEFETAKNDVEDFIQLLKSVDAIEA